VTKNYTIQLVGEQYYQPAVGRCRVGEIVDVCIEQGNPFDPLAIVVRRCDGGETIGYIARDSFVRRVIHEDGEGLAAAIASVEEGQRGFYQVALRVSVVDEPPETVRYRAGESSPPPVIASPETRNESTSGDIKISPLQLVLGIAIIVLLVRCMM
jgi:hypothetical protein